MTSFDPSSSIKTLPGTSHRFHSLPDTAKRFGINLDDLPFSLRPILEGIARNVGKNGITVEQLQALGNWPKPYQDIYRRSLGVKAQLACGTFYAHPFPVFHQYSR